MNTIRVLIVEPDKEPYQKRIQHTLVDMQNVVGGLIEFVELEYNVDLICNEEGKIHNLPMNRVIQNDIIAGTFFIAGHHNGDTISLSRKQIKKYIEIFKLKNDKELIQLLKYKLKESSNLLNVNLKNIGQLRGVIK